MGKKLEEIKNDTISEDKKPLDNDKHIALINQVQTDMLVTEMKDKALTMYQKQFNLLKSLEQSLCENINEDNNEIKVKIHKARLDILNSILIIK